MEAEERFVTISGLICEPTRARMLWNLLDGRAYTATELAVVADVSATAASNHLSRLLEAGLLKVETQGRHRYYSFARPEVAYAVEALANLSNDGAAAGRGRSAAPDGLRRCRTCYDHLAGFVGVEIVEALERKELLSRTETAYLVTEKGWEWLAGLDLARTEFAAGRRPLTRQCLDWSERRPHLAGRLGAAFLERTLARRWFEKVPFSRELIVTAQGRRELSARLGLSL